MTSGFIFIQIVFSKTNVIFAKQELVTSTAKNVTCIYA